MGASHAQEDVGGVNMTYVFFVSAALCALGLMLLLRHHKDMALK